MVLHKEPLVSVVVPVYNAEIYISRCIESILEQTYRNFELILVNDGSTDKSGAVCDEYAKNDDRIRVVHQVNGGVSSARNAGMNCAKGEYLFLWMRMTGRSRIISNPCSRREMRIWSMLDIPMSILMAGRCGQRRLSVSWPLTRKTEISSRISQ